jgi:hypothetical protein
MKDDVTLIRAVKRAALEAHAEARLACQFAGGSYASRALAQIELALVRLGESEPNVEQIKHAAQEALVEAKLAYEHAPGSYTFGTFERVDWMLRQLAEIEP